MASNSSQPPPNPRLGTPAGGVRPRLDPAAPPLFVEQGKQVGIAVHDRDQPCPAGQLARRPREVAVAVEPAPRLFAAFRIHRAEPAPQHPQR